jgi:hypothetical protein
VWAEARRECQRCSRTAFCYAIAVAVCTFGDTDRGQVLARADGQQDAIPLSDGDCFLFAPGNSYMLQDDPRTGAETFCSVATENGSQVIKYGGGGAPTTIIYGWFRFSATTMKPLARLLPPLILVRADQPQAFVLRTTMAMFASETAKLAPGSELVVQHLADILFVQCLRAHIESGSSNTRLLRAFFDPQIGAALGPSTRNSGFPGRLKRWPRPLACLVRLSHYASGRWSA